MIVYGFRVIEHFDNDPPEPFGSVVLAATPRPGDIVQLKWLDGRDAYSVRVDSVSGSTLHVTAAP